MRLGFVTILVAIACTSCAQAQTSSAPGDPPPLAERQLLFADEFDGPALDRTKWTPVGAEFWVNTEQQVYLDRPDTIAFAQGVNGSDGGVLVLKPLYKPGLDPRADRKADFISGRIITKDKFDFTYGRAEARIRMPDAAGVWPAFWLLGNGGWPHTGEIDIMEYVGEKDWTGVALHGPGYSGETPLVNKFTFDPGTDVTDWHTYAVEWTRDSILFEVDGRLTYRVTRPMVEHYGKWVYDTPEHLILNFAVGGGYPFKTNGVERPYHGLPVETAEAIKRGAIAMEVDWVRVWAPAE